MLQTIDLVIKSQILMLEIGTYNVGFKVNLKHDIYVLVIFQEYKIDQVTNISGVGPRSKGLCMTEMLSSESLSLPPAPASPIVKLLF